MRKLNLSQVLVLEVGSALLAALAFAAPWTITYRYAENNPEIYQARTPIYAPPTGWSSDLMHLSVTLDRAHFFGEGLLILAGTGACAFALRRKIDEAGRDREFRIPIWASHH